MRMRKKKHTDDRITACGALLIEEPSSMPGKWDELAHGRKLCLEIGCGKGTFVCETAKRNPDKFFIAVEKVRDVMVIAMEKAEPLELKNLRFIIADAANLCEYFEKGEVNRIYLNFSDPWKKNKQAKRRITHKNFLDVYKKVINIGDMVCFKTDNQKLFEFSLNSFAQEDFKMSNISFDLHNSGWEDNVMTEYESRFSEMGMPIYRVCAEYVR